MRSLVAVAVGLAALSAPIVAQQPSPIGVARAQSDAVPAAFEVASIKPNKSGSNYSQWGTERGGRFAASNVTAQQLVVAAYAIQDYQLLQSPRWFGSDHVDIVAKASGEIPDVFLDERRAGPTPIQLILRAFLADRFRLVVHKDTRDLPAYSLVMAQADGRFGPGLVRAEGDCSKAEQRAPATGKCSIRWGPGRLNATTMLLSSLASALSQFLGRPVIDRTMVKDPFDITLTWTPDQGAQQPGDALGEAPSLFTAIQEQLGLKLESTKGPVDVLVIDHVEHPTED